ncbi:MAG: hypothetical protein Q4D82_06495 [Neisseria sp.]|nr:hypothetical protein [Neisseria sp.]
MLFSDGLSKRQGRLKNTVRQTYRNHNKRPQHRPIHIEMTHIATIRLLCLTAFFGATPAFAHTCSPAEIEAILAPADTQNSSVEVRCSGVLPADSKVSKRLYFTGKQASGLNFDCNGSTIAPANADSSDAVLIRSHRENGRWLRPENLRLQNCRVEGSVRIQGMAANGEGAALRESSQQSDHTERAQQAAPSNIRLERFQINGHGRIPLYLAPGVTRISLTDSRVAGRSNSVAVYLDAESAHNLFERNTIESVTGRELIAIDGSAHNLFRANRFSSLNKGGIYLYRNCGEGGTVRHQTPSENRISGNTFFYRRYKGRLPSVWLGARNGNRNYCRADAGLPFGSSADDRDFADNNVIEHNRIFRLSPQKMIRDHGSGNRIGGNVTVYR